MTVIVTMIKIVISAISKMMIINTKTNYYVNNSLQLLHSIKFYAKVETREGYLLGRARAITLPWPASTSGPWISNPCIETQKLFSAKNKSFLKISCLHLNVSIQYFMYKLKKKILTFLTHNLYWWFRFRIILSFCRRFNFEQKFLIAM